MILIPAIDIKSGQCVRLRQGKPEDVTVFSKDPVSMAKYWLNKGSDRLHLVDLDGARFGKPKNNDYIESILNIVGNNIPLQVGGGIRNLKTIEYYLNSGISYVIIGTAAIENPNFLRNACRIFPGKIIVGLDVKNGKLAINGWSQLTNFNITDLVKKFEDYGSTAFIYTDINRDGMLSGIDIDSSISLIQKINVPVYLSGGISGIKDIENLCKLPTDTIAGVILGRSLYEGTLDFCEAKRLVNELI